MKTRHNSSSLNVLCVLLLFIIVLNYHHHHHYVKSSSPEGGELFTSSPSTQGKTIKEEDKQLEFYLDIKFERSPPSNNNNNTCMEMLMPCSSFTQIISSAATILNQTNEEYESVEIIIRMRGIITTCEVFIDFSMYTSFLTLTFTPFLEKETFEISTYSKLPEMCSLFQSKSKIEALHFVNGNINSDFSELELQKVLIYNSSSQKLMLNSLFLNCENSNINLFLNPKRTLNFMNILNSTLILQSTLTIQYVTIENSQLSGEIMITNFDNIVIRNSIITNTQSYPLVLGVGFTLYITDCQLRGEGFFFENIKEVFMTRISMSNYSIDSNVQVDQLSIFYLFNIGSAFIVESNFDNNKFNGIMFDLQRCIQVQFEKITFLNNNQVEFARVFGIGLGRVVISNSKLSNNTKLENALISQLNLKLMYFQISNCEFCNNIADDLLLETKGSSLSVLGSRLTIENSLFCNNKASKGGVIHASLAAQIVLSNSSFIQNEAIYGGAIYDDSSINGDGSISNTIKCDGNKAHVAGGCLYSIKNYDIKVEGENEATYYGNQLASELVEMQIEIQDKKNEIYQLINVNESIIEAFPGESLNFRIILSDRYQQKISKIQNGDIDLTIHDLNSFMIQRQDFASGNESILLSNTQILLKSQENVNFIEILTKLKIKIQNLEQIISIHVVNCPQGYSLSRNSLSSYKCTRIPIEIIIPSAIIGTISFFVILTAFVLGSIYIIKKLRKLRKQERAELEIQKKITKSNFEISSKSGNSDLDIPLLNCQNDSFKYIIPITDIKILTKLGEGANGIVYKGKWNRTNVAIKQLKTSNQQLDSEIEEEFEREAILMSSLRHPSIVSCFGVSLASNSKYMVVEYLENGSLEKALYDSKIGKEKLRFETKLNILIDVANGITYLHSIKPNKIIHRDLKPGNILLTKTMNAKVADFGLSKIVQSNTSATMTTNVGTLLYIAPELLSNYHKGNRLK